MCSAGSVAGRGCSKSDGFVLAPGRQQLAQRLDAVEGPAGVAATSGHRLRTDRQVVALGAERRPLRVDAQFDRAVRDAEAGEALHGHRQPGGAPHLPRESDRRDAADGGIGRADQDHGAGADREPVRRARLEDRGQRHQRQLGARRRRRPAVAKCAGFGACAQPAAITRATPHESHAIGFCILPSAFCLVPVP